MFKLMGKKIITILSSEIVLNWTYVISKKKGISFSEDLLYLSICADPGEMLHYHLGLHSLPKYLFWVFLIYKGSILI